MSYARRFAGWLLALVIVMAAAPVAAAQTIDHPCSEEIAPEDGFQSMGIGLTRSELAALYGEAEIGQGSLIYDFNGIDLHTFECDLILSFPQDGADGRQMHEFALAESLLPTAAEYVGAFTLGTTIAPNRDQTASLWRSASLAERFARMGEHRGGDILILYSYEPKEMEAGPIQRIELRTVEISG
jgi:hypothetical protein